MRLPVAARSVGHYRKEPGWREVPVHKAFVELFWSVAGEGWIVYDGKKHRFPPEHIALYFPGDPHLLGQDGAEL